MTVSRSILFHCLLSAILLAPAALADDWKKYDEAGSRARELKNFVEAEKQYQAALKEAAKSEPDGAGEKTARTLNNLALTYAGLERYADAEPLLQRALAILEKKKPGSRELARACSNLGWVYQQQRKFDLAEPFHKRALELRERSVGPGHFEVALTLEDLAFLYQAEGKLVESEAAWDRSLDIWKKLGTRNRHDGQVYLGDLADDPGIAHGLFNAGVFYYYVGKYAKAAPVLERCLEMQQTILGPNHEDVAATLAYVAAIDRETQRLLEASNFLQRAEAIVEKTFGPHDLKTANALSRLAAVYIDRHSLVTAEQLLTKALAIVDNLKNSDGRAPGPMYAPVYMLGKLRLEQGNPGDAEALLRRSLEILDSDLEDQKQPYAVVAKAEVIAGLGRAYSEQGRFREAESQFTQALSIFDSAGLGEHPKAIACLTNYADLLRKTGRQAEAELNDNRARVIRERLVR